MANVFINNNDRTARLILKGRDFSPQSAGSTPHVLLTKDLTYHQIIFNYERDGAQATEAQLLADVTNIQLKLNGRTFREGSATEFMDKAKGMGKTPSAGKLPIFLSEPDMRTIAGEDVNGIGTVGDVTFAIHVTYAAGAYAPNMTYTAVVCEDGRGPGDLIQQLPIPIDFAGGTYKEILHLPTDEGDLRWLHFYNGNISEMEIKVNKVTIFDGDVTDLAEIAAWTGWTMQAGILSWSPMFTNRRIHRLPLKSGDDIKVKMTLSAAANSFNCVMETEKVLMGRTVEPGKIQ